MTGSKVQNLSNTSLDSGLQTTLEKIGAISTLAKPPVCLPDIHMKEGTEAPCSFVAATEGVIIPELTAPSVGCGMGFLATTLTRQDITPEKLEAFYRHMREHLGPRYGLFENVFLWLGIKKRPERKYDFSESELRAVIEHGAEAALKKYGLSSETLAHIEYGGNVIDEETRKLFPSQSILPRAAWATGRHDIGYGFKGNHFLEVQYVDEVIDPIKAREWGLAPDAIIIMYHGGGGAVSYYMGRYFANRRKDRNKLRSRTFQSAAKFLFHFASRDGIKHWSERWRYYFRPHQFQQIPANTFEGKRLMASVKASLNYSYAFRLAIAKRIMDSLTQAFGQHTKSQLVWDSIHNSIHEESINGKNLIVHRHTATRTFEGKPVIVSGFNNTSSYIGVGLPHAEEHLFSADHGAGETIKRHLANNKSQPHPQKFITEIYTTKPPYKKNVEHITNEGLEAVVRPLEQAGVIRPVAMLRPIAVFKG